MLPTQRSRGLAPLFCAILMLAFSSPAGSQQPVAAANQPPITATDQQPMGTMKVNVNVVNVYLNVKDKHGALIPNLHKDDFQLFEDGSPQPIKYFTAETDQPLTLGLLIDTSPSQARVLPMEQQVGAAFLDEVLRPKDLAFLIAFDANIDLLEDYTASARDLRRAMDRVHVGGGGIAGGAPGLGQGPFPTSNRNCCTALYDAIYLAADEKLAHEVGRKAMILLTDGEDAGSQMKIRDAVEEAQKADAICYVILIADRGFYGGMGYSGDSAMRQLTEDTGGRVIEVGNKPEKLKAAFDQIANELRSQYGIGYTPTNLKKDGTFRKIEVRTKEGYKVQARRGYYAIQQE